MIIAVIFVVESAGDGIVRIVAERQDLEQKAVELIVAQIENIGLFVNIVILAVDVRHITAEIIVVTEAVRVPHLNIVETAAAITVVALRERIVKVFDIVIGDRHTQHVQITDLARHALAQIEQIGHAHTEQRPRPVVRVAEKQLVVIQTAMGHGVALHDADRLRKVLVGIQNTDRKHRPDDLLKASVLHHLARGDKFIGRKLTVLVDFCHLAGKFAGEVIDISLAALTVAEHIAQHDRLAALAVSALRIQPRALSETHRNFGADRLVVVIDRVVALNGGIELVAEVVVRVEVINIHRKVIAHHALQQQTVSGDDQHFIRVRSGGTQLQKIPNIAVQLRVCAEVHHLGMDDGVELLHVAVAVFPVLFGKQLL